MAAGKGSKSKWATFLKRHQTQLQRSCANSKKASHESGLMIELPESDDEGFGALCGRLLTYKGSEVASHVCDGSVSVFIVVF